MTLWDSHRCPVGHLMIASSYSFAGHQPSSPSITGSTSTSSIAWSLPTFSRSWERAGSASALPALPGNQYGPLACFPNKRLHAPSLLTHLCLGEASHTPPPNHFLHCGARECKEPDHLLYAKWRLTPLDSLVLPTSLVAGGRGCCLAGCSRRRRPLGRTHPSQYCSSAGPSSTPETLLVQGVLGQKWPHQLLHSRHKVWPRGAGHQRQQSLLLLFVSPRDRHSRREASLCLLTWLIGLKPLIQKQPWEGL